MSAQPHDLEACRRVLIDGMAARGIEVTVSTEPLIVPSPYSDRGLTCPHGTRFYIQPTNEQIAEWRREGVR